MTASPRETTIETRRYTIGDHNDPFEVDIVRLDWPDGGQLWDVYVHVPEEDGSYELVDLSPDGSLDSVPDHEGASLMLLDWLEHDGATYFPTPVENSVTFTFEVTCQLDPRVDSIDTFHYLGDQLLQQDTVVAVNGRRQ